MSRGPTACLLAGYLGYCSRAAPIAIPDETGQEKSPSRAMRGSFRTTSVLVEFPREPGSNGLAHQSRVAGVGAGSHKCPDDLVGLKDGPGGDPRRTSRGPKGAR